MSQIHAEACNKICRGCGNKVKMRKIYDPPYEQPDINHSRPLDENLVSLAATCCEVTWSPDLGDDSLEPRRICTSCRLLLISDNRCLEYGLKPIIITRTHSQDSCNICKIAFAKGRPKKAKTGPTAKKSPPLQYVKICNKCFQESKRGVSHVCQKNCTPQNVIMLTRQSFINPLSLVPAIVEKGGNYNLQLGRRGRRTIAVSAGPQKIKVQVSADDLLTESSHHQMSRRMLINKSQLWRERLDKPGIKAEIAGAGAVNKLREQRIGDLFDIDTLRANCGTEKNPKFADVPVVRCTNVVTLARRVVAHRGTVIHYVKIQGDHGQKALKVSAQFTESNSVNDLMILAATECSGESCVTIGGILDIIKPYELEKLGVHLIWAGDLKWIQLMEGIKTGNTAFPCPWCYWRMTGAERMLCDAICPKRRIREDIITFERGGCNREKTLPCHGQQFIPAYIINPEEVSPPTLHILLGLLNQIDQKLAEKHSEEDIITHWYIPSNVRKSKYQGGTFEGNQCKKLIRTAAAWKRGHKFWEYQPLFLAFQNLVENVFSVRSDLSDEDIFSIALTIQEFTNMWDYYRRNGLALTNPLKLHVLAVHVLEFCTKFRCTPAAYGEQDGESLHRRFWRLWDTVKAQSYRAMLTAVKHFNAGNF